MRCINYFSRFCGRWRFIRRYAPGGSHRRRVPRRARWPGNPLPRHCGRLCRLRATRIEWLAQRIAHRAIDTIAMVNELFPENGTAFLNAVLMPRNMYDIQDVMRFATEIGWSVSIVPAHVSTPDKPRGFRTFDDSQVVTFTEEQYPEVRKVVESFKELHREGYNVYDSDEYLDDVYRFVTRQPIQWRRRNGNVCDSPNLYFAIAPNGNMKVCCDFELNNAFPVYDPEFPNWYRDGRIHEQVYAFTRSCDGCMYGSYPEITVTARYFKPMLERLLYFNVRLPTLKKYAAQEMREIAARILCARTGEYLDRMVDRAKIPPDPSSRADLPTA